MMDPDNLRSMKLRNTNHRPEHLKPALQASLKKLQQVVVYAI